MTKNKQSKSLLKPPKRNNKRSSTSDIHEEDTMDTKAKKKKRMKAEVSKRSTKLIFNFTFMYKMKHNI